MLGCESNKELLESLQIDKKWKELEGKWLIVLKTVVQHPNVIDLAKQPELLKIALET